MLTVLRGTIIYGAMYRPTLRTWVLVKTLASPTVHDRPGPRAVNNPCCPHLITLPHPHTKHKCSQYPRPPHFRHLLIAPPTFRMPAWPTASMNARSGLMLPRHVILCRSAFFGQHPPAIRLHRIISTRRPPTVRPHITPPPAVRPSFRSPDPGNSTILSFR